MFQHAGAGGLVDAMTRLTSGGFAVAVILIVGAIPAAAIVLMGVLRKFSARS
jgi:hypothetical protein